MAKKKILKRKKSVSKTKRGNDIAFHSWTFFAFLLFVLLAALIVLLQQKGIHLFKAL